MSLSNIILLYIRIDCNASGTKEKIFDLNCPSSKCVVYVFFRYIAECNIHFLSENVKQHDVLDCIWEGLN